MIVETLDGGRARRRSRCPAVLVASHGPFTWGRDRGEAVDNAIALEVVAAIAIRTLALDPNAEPMADHLLDRHYRAQARRRAPTTGSGR